MISLDGSTMIEGNFRPHGLEYRSISFQTPYCLRVSRNHVKPWTVQTWKPCKPMESTETMENNSENSEQTNVGIFEPVSACTDEPVSVCTDNSGFQHAHIHFPRLLQISRVTILCMNPHHLSRHDECQTDFFNQQTIHPTFMPKMPV